MSAVDDVDYADFGEKSTLFQSAWQIIKLTTLLGLVFVGGAAFLYYGILKPGDPTIKQRPARSSQGSRQQGGKKKRELVTDEQKAMSEAAMKDLLEELAPVKHSSVRSDVKNGSSKGGGGGMKKDEPSSLAKKSVKRKGDMEVAPSGQVLEEVKILQETYKALDAKIANLRKETIRIKKRAKIAESSSDDDSSDSEDDLTLEGCLLSVNGLSAGELPSLYSKLVYINEKMETKANELQEYFDRACKERTKKSGLKTAASPDTVAPLLTKEDKKEGWDVVPVKRRPAQPQQRPHHQETGSSERTPQIELVDNVNASRLQVDFNRSPLVYGEQLSDFATTKLDDDVVGRGARKHRNRRRAKQQKVVGLLLHADEDDD